MTSLMEPGHSPPLVLIPEHFGCLVFDRRTSRYLPFDRESTTFLERLLENGIGPTLEATMADRERDALLAFYEEFERRGFFTLDGKLAAVRLPIEPPRDHLAGPLALHLEIVAACNLTCTHCFAGDLPRREQPLNLEDLDRLFREMASQGSFRLGLTGGEPLLRKELFEILDLALAHGLCPCLTTNGLMIDERTAREFGTRQLVWLNVSLDGATEATNDAVRGSGNFRRVLEKLDLLRKHARFTLAFTLMKPNLSEVQECAALARRVGAHTAVFRPLYPVGVARRHPELWLDADEYAAALDTLQRCTDEQGELREIDPFSPRLRAGTQPVIFGNYGCGAGNTVCSISVSGDVNPCSFLGTEFIAGNVRRQSLAEIWRNSHGFRAIRALPTAEPGSGAVFSGGCRARALVLNGSVNAPDPWVDPGYQVDTGAASAVRKFHPLTVLELDGLSRGERDEA